MFLAHKIRLFPTPEQEVFLAQCTGVRRFIYNSLLAYAKETNFDRAALYMRLCILRQNNPWIKDVSAQIGKSVITDIERAYKSFFRKQGYPRFKKKGAKESFSLRQSTRFTVTGTKLRLERLKTKLQMEQKLRFNGIAKHVTVSLKGGYWFASILVDTTNYADHSLARKPSVGVDLGIKSLAALSDGTVFEANQPLKQKQQKIAQLQRKLARQQKGSNRYLRTKKRIASLHFYAVKQRNDTVHQLTHYLTTNYDRIVIEDLNVKGLSKKPQMARMISDASLSNVRTQLEYKSFLRGNDLVVADRWFPSSKLCSCCGHKLDELDLSVREWTCPKCNTLHDRDENAAKNLDSYSPDTFKRDFKTDVERNVISAEKRQFIQ